MANAKITDLPADGAPVDGSVLEVAALSGGSFTSKKLSLSSFAAFLFGKLDSAPLSLARGGTGVSSLSKLIGSINPGYTPGMYYPVLDRVPLLAAASTANTLVLSPFLIRSEITINELDLRVTNAVAGNMSLAIYRHSYATGKPTGTALVTGTGSTGTAAMVAMPISATVLTAGIYWLAYNTDSTASVQAGSAVVGMAGLVGAPSASDVNSAANLSRVNYTFAQTYGTSPDLTAATLTSSTVASSILGIFRVSAVPG